MINLIIYLIFAKSIAWPSLVSGVISDNNSLVSSNFSDLYYQYNSLIIEVIGER